MEALTLIIILAALLGIAYLVNKELMKGVKTLDQARQAYQDSLSKLKSDPANADLRQKTLQLGRLYSNLTRHKRGVTVFDEVALMNDINAACAGAASMPGLNRKAASEQTVEERLARLTELRSKGLIDEFEYRSKRHKILDEI